MVSSPPKKKAIDGMVLHGIKFKVADWDAAVEAAEIVGSDNVSAFVREAVREKVARAREKKAKGR